MQESYLHVGEGDWYKTVEEPFPLLRHCGWAGRDGVYLCQNPAKIERKRERLVMLLLSAI